jgi:hypothetical protein
MAEQSNVGGERSIPRGLLSEESMIENERPTNAIVAGQVPTGAASVARIQPGASRREILDTLLFWERRVELFADFREDLAVLRQTLWKATNEPGDELPYIEKDGDVIVARPGGSLYRGFIDAITYMKDKTLQPPNSVPVVTLGDVLLRIVLTRAYASTLGNPDGL